MLGIRRLRGRGGDPRGRPGYGRVLRRRGLRHRSAMFRRVLAGLARLRIRVVTMHDAERVPGTTPGAGRSSAGRWTSGPVCRPRFRAQRAARDSNRARRGDRGRERGELFDDWERPGIAHFRQPHNFLGLARRVLLDEAPEVLNAVLRVSEQWRIVSTSSCRGRRKRRMSCSSRSGLAGQCSKAPSSASSGGRSRHQRSSPTRG